MKNRNLRVPWETKFAAVRQEAAAWKARYEDAKNQLDRQNAIRCDSPHIIPWVFFMILLAGFVAMTYLYLHKDAEIMSVPKTALMTCLPDWGDGEY